jgi:hypothetical protein
MARGLVALQFQRKCYYILNHILVRFERRLLLESASSKLRLINAIDFVSLLRIRLWKYSSRISSQMPRRPYRWHQRVPFCTTELDLLLENLLTLTFYCTFWVDAAPWIWRCTSCSCWNISNWHPTTALICGLIRRYLIYANVSLMLSTIHQALAFV